MTVEGQGGAGNADAMLAAFARWSDDERQREASVARGRERWLRQQEMEAATLSGTLVDLAERGAEVALLLGARRLVGRLVGVGPDLCVLEGQHGSSSLISLRRLGAVMPTGPVAGLPGRPGPAGGDRCPPIELGFAGALAALAAEMLPVRLLLAGGEVLAGDLVGAGADVVTVLLPTSPRSHAHAAIRAIDVCTPT